MEEGKENDQICVLVSIYRPESMWICLELWDFWWNCFDEIID